VVYQALQNKTKTHQQRPDGLTCPQQITHLLALHLIFLFDSQLQIPHKNFYENIWTSVLSSVKFREATDLRKVDKRKIAACYGKTLTPS
uniref:Uncharacterized protein n=1 Tax=Cyanistes caeruleus TaxID=156563 RepID=A0A8C0VIZ1_CYACU